MIKFFIPVEIWERILDYAMNPNINTQTLFTFYQINPTTRSILSNPNHKYWVKSITQINQPVFPRQCAAYEKWLYDRHISSRKVLRIALFDKCMMCDEVKDTKLYWQFQKRLCFICLHKYTIDEQSARWYHGVRNAYRLLPYEVIAILPGMEYRTTKRRFHYWKFDFLKVISDPLSEIEEFSFKDPNQTPKQYERVKKMLLQPLGDERMMSNYMRNMNL